MAINYKERLSIFPRVFSHQVSICKSHSHRKVEGHTEHRYNPVKILHTLSKIKPHQLCFTCTKTCLKTLFFCLKEKRYVAIAVMKFKQGVSDSNLEPQEDNNKTRVRQLLSCCGVYRQGTRCPQREPTKNSQVGWEHPPPPQLGALNRG